MENHELAIGTMKTDCRIAAYPQAVAPLRARLERSFEGPFPALLAKAAEPVLQGRDGVFRIRNVKLDLAHHGEWDEKTLAELIASRLAVTLARLLDAPNDTIRSWPNHDAYMASFIEYKLGLVHEPDWAFPEFGPLRLLSPEQAAAEVLKSRPDVFAALAVNGRRVGNAHRVAARFGAATAADIVKAWLSIPGMMAEPVPADLFDDGSPLTAGILSDPQSADIHQQILKLVCELALQSENRQMPQLISAAIILAAMAALQADKAFLAVHGHAPSSAITTLAAGTLPLPTSIAGFLKQAVSRHGAAENFDRLFGQISGEAAQGHAGKSASKRMLKTGKPKLQTIHSPFAGFALLLPDIVRLGMHRQLSSTGLRDAVLAIADPEMCGRLEHDEFLLSLFPEVEGEPEPPFPPIPGAIIAMLAPESRHLMTGRESAGGWADLLLASFATRLPGLRASSRGYIIRQFLAVPGRADITDTSIIVTLDGPALAIVLKMAGLSGDQMPIPFFGNRLLILKLGGSR